MVGLVPAGGSIPLSRSSIIWRRWRRRGSPFQRNAVFSRRILPLRHLTICSLRIRWSQRITSRVRRGSLPADSRSVGAVSNGICARSRLSHWAGRPSVFRKHVPRASRTRNHDRDPRAHAYRSGALSSFCTQGRRADADAAGLIRRERSAKGKGQGRLGGLKPLQAAAVKSRSGERWSRSSRKTLSR